MHSKTGKIIAVLITLLVVAGAVFIAKKGITFKTTTEEVVEETAYTNDKETIRIWYTDDALSDYLSTVSVSYNSEHEDIRIVPELVSGREYLENISKASVTDGEVPDLFITTNDTLEKAHLAGLASEISVPENIDLSELFPEVAINSATYNNKIVGYPFYFECSALLYNKSYLDKWGRDLLEAEIRSQMAEEEKENKKEAEKNDSSKQDEDTAKQEDDSVAEAISAQVSEEDVANLIEEYFPTNIDKLLVFSDNYDAPEGVESIFKWAVTDIFYNYFFIGDAINIGGQYGDNDEEIDIYNETAIKGLQTYQNLNQFFSINTSDVSYDGVMDEFQEGSIVMTIATTDAVNRLKAAKEDESLSFEYAFAPLPDIFEDRTVKSMSVTDVIAVNGYSSNKEAANDFAAYLCSQDGNALYERARKVSTLKNADYGENDEYISVFMREYEKSVPLPKMLETSNYWINLELLFAEVWDGADPNEGLKKLSEQMKLQITGEEIEEEAIVIEEEAVEEDEIIETETLDDTPTEG